MPKIVDGKKLAEALKEELKKEVGQLGKSAGRRMRLAVIYIGENPASESFIKIKKAFGRDIGIEVEVKKPPEEIRKSREKLRKWISQITHDKKNTGVIIQLPLPDEIKNRTQYILDSIPTAKDVDVLSSDAIGKFANGRSKAIPPVVGAVEYVFEKNEINLEGKNVVIVGAGLLVGKPVALRFLGKRIPFSVLTTKSPDFSDAVSKADIIISGAGKAGLIGADMVKNGVVAIDAGTSSDLGQIKGDFDPAVAEKASLFTPVPGGVGPMTVAMLFMNLIKLAKKK